jgi:sugar/nucleoside kinase (ribokinase family)
MKSFDIVTVGGSMRDIFFSTQEGKVVRDEQDPLCHQMIAFELGAKVYVDQVNFESGGGANNTAAGFSSLGLKTALLSRVGNDREGDSLIKDAQAHKVDTSFIEVDKQVSTGFTFILGLKGIKRAQTIFAYRGTSDILKIPQMNFKTKWIYISSLSCSDWPKLLDRLFAFKKKGVKFAWNPSNVQLKAGAQKLSRWLKQTDALILNEDETKELVFSAGKKIKNLKTRDLTAIAQKLGPEVMVVTVGKKGAYAADEKKIYFQKPCPSKVVNITGAGDSFAAGFVSSLFYQPSNLSQALLWGSKNSASVINSVGAQKGLLSKRQISS